jgi:hypothetical protein
VVHQDQILHIRAFETILKRLKHSYNLSNRLETTAMNILFAFFSVWLFFSSESNLGRVRLFSARLKAAIVRVMTVENEKEKAPAHRIWVVGGGVTINNNEPH